MRTADVLGGEGETCGGMLSLRCVKGLACDMPDDAPPADAIGTCTRRSTCRK
jgi:hypothetical protein